MTNDKTRLLTGGAIAIVLAAGAGFGIARLTQPSAPAVVAANAPSEAEPQAAADTVAISPEAIRASQIAVAPATSGELDAAIPASATIQSTPDAEAVLTARAAGTVTRIFKRIGDPVRAGETIALVESRDASAIAADRAVASARVALAQRQLAREAGLLKQGVSPRADFETAQSNLAVARADAGRAAAAAGAARVASDGRSVAVVSPITGRLTAALATLGTYVAPETPLFRIADPTRLQITASLPPADASRVRAGDRVELITNDDQTIGGTVRSATGVVDPQSRTATVIVTPATGGSMLVPGQLVKARIFASRGAVRSAVLLPQDAVQTVGDKTVVFVRTRTGFTARPVRPGARSGGMVAIMGGLPVGTLIATNNAFLLKAEVEKNAGGDE